MFKVLVLVACRGRPGQAASLGWQMNARATAAAVPRFARPSPAIVIFVLTRAATWSAAALALAWFSGHGSAFGTGLWVRADSNWYTSIARHGYAIDPQEHAAFFPLYPTLIAGLGRLLGDYNLAGLLSFARLVRRGVRAALAPRGATGRQRHRDAGRALPRALPDGRLSRSRLFGIAVPRARTGRVPARRA